MFCKKVLLVDDVMIIGSDFNELVKTVTKVDVEFYDVFILTRA
ncbi:hypothetical protein [Candidatus Ruthturnera calyptogenae]|nr:hypothetical protein [Candidatus Ruthturnera calyptogenae]